MNCGLPAASKNEHMVYAEHEILKAWICLDANRIFLFSFFSKPVFKRLKTECKLIPVNKSMEYYISKECNKPLYTFM